MSWLNPETHHAVNALGVELPVQYYIRGRPVPRWLFVLLTLRRDV